MEKYFFIREEEVFSLLNISKNSNILQQIFFLVWLALIDTDIIFLYNAVEWNSNSEYRETDKLAIETMKANPCLKPSSLIYPQLL